MRSELRPASARALAALCALCCACANTSGGGEESGASGVQAPARTGEVHDPWEDFNRAIFAFNEAADLWVIEPLAVAWDFALPEPVQLGVDNFFDNLHAPRRLANDLLQGKPRDGAETLGRFLINTSFGVGGLFDPAVRNGWLPAHDEDFGQTLGVWGVPPGPYLVLPVFGPSNPRDATGLVVDGYMRPETYFLAFYVNFGSWAVENLNVRARALEDLRAERAAAFDFYAAVRRAYIQYRANQVRDAEDVPEDSDDDDFFDLEEE